MPSRKLTDRCPRCDGKNHLRARFCNDCGARLPEDRAEKDMNGRAKLHVDIAHPINSMCRDEIQKRVLAAFKEEMEHVKQPDYEPAINEDDEEDYCADGGDEAPAAVEEDETVERKDDNFGKGLF
jgi:stage V sporulation protein G